MGNQEESWLWNQRKAVGKNREEGEEWARTCGRWMHLPTCAAVTRGASPTARVLIVITRLLTPWNQAASTNKWDTSAGLSCNRFWVSSSPLMNHTTKHHGHRRLLSAHRFATKDKKKAAAPCTALCSHPPTVCKRLLTISVLQVKCLHGVASQKATYLPECLLCPQAYWSIYPPTWSTQTSVKRSAYFISRINMSNVI